MKLKRTRILGMVWVVAGDWYPGGSRMYLSKDSIDVYSEDSFVYISARVLSKDRDTPTIVDRSGIEWEL